MAEEKDIQQHAENKEAAEKTDKKNNTAGKDAEPKKAAPKDAEPKESAPKESAPKKAAPKDAAPKESAPKESSLNKEADAQAADAPEKKKANKKKGKKKKAANASKKSDASEKKDTEQEKSPAEGQKADAPEASETSDAQAVDAPEPKVAIRLTNVTKYYKLYKSNGQRFMALLFRKNIPFKKKVAIDNLSLTIMQGESVGIIGKVGSGKSTLIRMLDGVSFPSKGTIEVNGEERVFDIRSGFDGEFTGRQNMKNRAKLLGMSEKEYKEKEQQMVDFADIGDYMDQPLRMYPVGMDGLVGYAVSFECIPEILLIDEGLGVGDQASLERCMDRMAEVSARPDVTFVFATTAMKQLKKTCKRGIVMDKGKIVFDGKIMEALEYYNVKILGNPSKKKKASSHQPPTEM